MATYFEFRNQEHEADKLGKTDPNARNVFNDGEVATQAEFNALLNSAFFHGAIDADGGADDLPFDVDPDGDGLSPGSPDGYDFALTDGAAELFRKLTFSDGRGDVKSVPGVTLTGVTCDWFSVEVDGETQTFEDAALIASYDTGADVGDGAP